MKSLPSHSFTQSLSHCGALGFENVDVELREENEDQEIFIVSFLIILMRFSHKTATSILHGFYGVKPRLVVDDEINELGSYSALRGRLAGQLKISQVLISSYGNKMFSPRL